MYRIVLILSCLAYIGHGTANRRKSTARASSKDRINQAKLVELLLRRSPAAAFNPSALGARLNCFDQRYSATKMAMPPADLTPGVDKFAVQPSGSELETVVITKDQPIPAGPDPFKCTKDEIKPMSECIPGMVDQNPAMKMAVSKFLETRTDSSYRATAATLVGRALSHADTAESSVARQIQLAQITEMIHVAGLVHDEIPDIDSDDVKKTAGAMLAGDFLLAKASVALARLEHQQVVELIASALASTIEGRWLEGAPKEAEDEGEKIEPLDMHQYLSRCYFKTASLFSLSCKSNSLLAGYDQNDTMTLAAEEYGYHLGMVYQIVDDILNLASARATLASAPMLLASEVEPSLKPLIERRFENAGDREKAVSLVKGTDGVEKSYKLAGFHAQKALDALERFPESESREALVILVHQVLRRK